MSNYNSNLKTAKQMCFIKGIINISNSLWEVFKKVFLKLKVLLVEHWYRWIFSEEHTLVHLVPHMFFIEQLHSNMIYRKHASAVNQIEQIQMPCAAMPNYS